MFVGHLGEEKDIERIGSSFVWPKVAHGYLEALVRDVNFNNIK